MQNNLKKYRHIIWDWNGTLMDDAWLCVEILNHLLRKYNLPTVTCEEYQLVFGFPVEDYYRRLGFDFSVEPYETIAKEFITEYNRRRFETKLHNCAATVLTAFTQANLTQSILSAYEQTQLEETVDFFDVRDFFIKIVGLNDYYAASKIDHGKKLIDDLDFDPHEILLIGDTIHDFEVANSIGVDCILIPGGHQSIERLKACRACVLDSLTQIEQYCKNS